MISRGYAGRSALDTEVEDIYSEADQSLSNEQLYAELARRGHQVNQYGHIGSAGKRYNLFLRKVRWVQQSLRQKSLLIRTGEAQWELTSQRKIQLRSITAAKSVIAVSTNLGMAIWGRSEVVGKALIDEPVHLILSSTPYPLKRARAYGNPSVDEFTDFISSVIEPWIDRLAPGGSIALNVSNDIFEDKSPARSTYLEEMVLGLKRRFGLSLMDRMPWVSNKPPGPIQYASLSRVQLNTGYEHIIWMTNDPLKCFSNNQRVLQEHSDQHKRFVSNGGVKKHAVNGDGAYVKYVGAYANQTAGRIPTNVLQYSNYCRSGRAVSEFAKYNGLPPHGAKFPVSLCNFLIEFLTDKDQLVVDPFGGTLTVGESAQMLDRRWICVEMMWEYIRQSFPRFEQFGNEVWWNPDFVRQFKPL